MTSSVCLSSNSPPIKMQESLILTSMLYNIHCIILVITLYDMYNEFVLCVHFIQTPWGSTFRSLGKLPFHELFLWVLNISIKECFRNTQATKNYRNNIPTFWRTHDAIVKEWIRKVSKSFNSCKSTCTFMNRS